MVVLRRVSATALTCQTQQSLLISGTEPEELVNEVGRLCLEVHGMQCYEQLYLWHWLLLLHTEYIHIHVHTRTHTHTHT